MLHLSVLSLQVNPWPLAPLGGPWVLEGAGHGPPPKILGQVLSWSQARTGLVPFQG